jgi:hypothetical protein
MNPRVVLIFVDGLGVGDKDPERNPMASVGGGCLSVFSNGEAGRPCFEGVVRPLDACLGFEGLPQSATGQTALLTGVNAVEALGYHLFGFPNQTLRDIILDRSLLKQVTARGMRAAFLNAFRPRFFEMGDEVWEKVPLSVTTWVNHAAGLPFFTLDDVAAERSIYQEFTNTGLRQRGFDVPIFTPARAGAILAERSRDFDLLLYEYFRTDAAGHSRDMTRAEEEILRLEEFLHAFLQRVDLDETLVILTSDHGNIEDLSVRGHTRNPALTLLWGRGCHGISQKLHSLLDVTPAILDFLGSREEPA